MRVGYLCLCFFVISTAALADERIRETKRVVAEVFGKKITLSDLDPGERELQTSREQTPQRAENEILLDIRSSRLATLIWKPILAEFSKRHGIEPTEDEVDDFLKAMDGLSTTAHKKNGEERHLSIDQIQEIRRTTARHWVRTWKISKTLYEEHGGRVIFQQGNPLEPVGAYRKLLEGHREKGDFKIYDEHLRDKFWWYYLEDRRVPVPEEQIDFSKPWWSKIGTGNEEQNDSTRR